MSKKTVVETIVIILTAIISVAKLVFDEPDKLEVKDDDDENFSIL